MPAGAAGDEAIDRPLTVRRAEGLLRQGDSAPAPAQGLPSDFRPREFPRVLRDPARAPGPDGILWRRLRAARPDLDLGEFLTPSPDRLRSGLQAARAPVDTVRVLALRIDFLRDSAGPLSTTPDGRFDLRDSTGLIVDPPPHNRSFYASHMEALRRYYWKQSGGTLFIDYDIYPAEEDSAYHLADTIHYGPWEVANSGAILALAERFVRDAFAAADTAEEPPDFRRYESFILFHAGPDLQGDILRDSPYDIPSFNVFLADPVCVQDSTFFIDLIMVMPEAVSQDGYTAALNGVLAHEFGHQLGFFDLYNVLDFSPMVGMFSLMDSGEQLYGTVAADTLGERVLYVRGAIPASLDPWHKLLFFPNGVRARWVTGDLQTTLPAVQTGNELLLAPIGGQWLEYLDRLPGWWAPWYASEYFILENRPFDLNGDGTVILETDPLTGVFLGPGNIRPDEEGARAEADTLGAYEQDYLLPGSGVLIWHVDNAAIQAASNVCYGCINISRERRGVDVEEADGIEDLGDLYSVEWTGGAFDYWFQGGYTRFGTDTRPDTRSGAGGATGIEIAVLDSAGPSMRVALKRGFVRPGWPVYAGDPLSDESVNIVDIDGDGTPDIFAAGGRDVLGRYGREVLAFWPDGGGYPYADAGGHFALVDGTLLPGIAAHPAFIPAQGRSLRLLAAATNTRVHAWDAFGTERMRYPGGGAVAPALRFTTAPTLLDSVIVVGDSEGRLRGLLPGAANPLLWRTGPSGAAVTALAAGDLFGDGSAALVWGDALGALRVATGSQRDGYAPAEGWPVALGGKGAGILSLLLIEGPAGEPGRLLALDEEGTLGLFGPDGSALDGWPRTLGGRPSGPAVAGDPDGDGVLEYLVTTEEGLIHCFQERGAQELRWPRSVWHPDASPFARVSSGPLLVDVTGDGRPEILQASGDGTLHAFTADGDGVPGWPFAAGYPLIAGPYAAPLGERGEIQLLLVDAMGFATVLDLGLPAGSEGPGEMWRSDGGPSRTHAYARARLPQPAGFAGLIDPRSILFTPNPVRGETGRLRFRMGQPGRLKLALYDTSGQRVWEGVRAPDSLEEETVWDLGLAGLASGLYVARMTVEGAGAPLRLTRKLAVVR